MNGIDENTVRLILESSGWKAEKVNRIGTGKFNDSFYASVKPSKDSLPDADEVVVRIAPPDDAGFIFYEKNMMRREPALHEQIRRETSLPVPAILVHDFSRSVIDRDFLIMERLPGEPLSGANLDAAAVNRAMEQTGEYLRELHETCRANAHGYPSGPGSCMEAKRKWADAFHVMWNNLVDDIAGCGVYSEIDAATARKALDKHITAFERELEPVLLHMDVWSQNILVDKKGSVVGIVDWDRGLFGDVEIEFSVLDYCGFNNAAFWSGYGKQVESSPGTRIRAAFYHLYEVQKYLVIYTLRRPQRERVRSMAGYSLSLLEQLVK